MVGETLAYSDGNDVLGAAVGSAVVLEVYVSPLHAAEQELLL